MPPLGAGNGPRQPVLGGAFPPGAGGIAGHTPCWGYWWSAFVPAGMNARAGIRCPRWGQGMARGACPRRCISAMDGRFVSQRCHLWRRGRVARRPKKQSDDMIKSAFKGDKMPKSSLFYHFTWSTKNRQPLLNDSNRKIIYKSIIAKAVELRSIILEIRAIEDHIHLLVSAPPTMAPSKLIGQLKGVSSHLVRKLGWMDFSWQSEYGVYSVSESQLPVVMAYIQNQEKHHRKADG
jgi:putative transposase